MHRYALLLLGVVLTCTAAADEDGAVAARLSGEPISLVDVDREAGARLMALRSQEYTLRRQALERIGPRGCWSGKREVALQRAAVEARLVQQVRMQRRAAYLAELEAHAKLEVALEPPRVAVGADDDPALGPSDAAVTLIAFSDFQCPYCARVEPTLTQLRERYPTQLRVVFRDFPLAMHKEALKAAEAAGCADEQGRFWPMHERLFANPKALGVEDLRRYAADLGLDASAFATCLDSGRRVAEVHADLRAGAEAGVTGTPAFFVNGRFLNGALPLGAFVDVIEDELRRARAAPTASTLQP